MLKGAQSIETFNWSVQFHRLIQNSVSFKLRNLLKNKDISGWRKKGELVDKDLYKRIMDNKGEPKKRFWRIIIIVAGCILAFIFPYKTVETALFPVTDQTMITSFEEIDDGIIVHLSFNKRRQCHFTGLEWYKGDRSRVFEKLQVKFLEDGDTPIGSRAQGRQSAGPWMISGVDLHTFRDHTFAIARHRCHFLWETETFFYR